MLHLAAAGWGALWFWRRNWQRFSWQNVAQGAGILGLLGLALALLIGDEPLFGLLGWTLAVGLSTWLWVVIYQKRKPSPTLRLLDWPLAAGAMLAIQHGWKAPMDLYGGPVSARQAKRARRYLKRKWDITDGESWQETADWLLEEGQRLAFQNEIARLVQMDDAQRVVYLTHVDAGEVSSEDEADKMELHARIAWIEQEGPELLHRSFMGWDMLRLIDLSRWALRAGWIEEETTEGYLMAAAQALQQRCHGWEEAQRQYLAGFRFWSDPTYQAQKEAYEKIIQRLLKHRKSPWRRVPWELQLTPEVPRKA